MSTTKNKTVKVNVNGKEFSFCFHPIADLNPEDLLCSKVCPLNEVCGKLKDPRTPDDPEANFNDFCLSSGGNPDRSVDEILNDATIENLMPVLEDVAKYAKETNTDIYQEIIKDNPLVSLNEVIDCMCGPDGYECSMYNKEHSNCTSTNGLCVLKKIFKV